VNFITLGAIVEKVTGQRLDVYAQEHVFTPLGMTHTRYLPFDRACVGTQKLGAAVLYYHGVENRICGSGSDWWSGTVLEHIAPTQHDNEGTAKSNPDFDHLLRGTVHDPTTRRMGGVAGHAGVFSTAADVGKYAQALLDRLAGRPSEFPLEQATLELMTTPQQPGHTARQIDAANDAARETIAETPNTTDPLLAPSYPAITGQNLRGFGWDIDTGLSQPRGRIFPIGSFGHSGFTGTALWLDPGSDTYVVVLTNAIHTRGSPPTSKLTGEVATATAQALNLYNSASSAPTSTPARRTHR